MKLSTPDSRQEDDPGMKKENYSMLDFPAKAVEGIGSAIAVAITSVINLAIGLLLTAGLVAYLVGLT